MQKRYLLVTLFTLVPLLNGCAINVPSMGHLGDKPEARELPEGDLASHIRCELRLAVQRIDDEIAKNENAQQENPNLPTSNSVAWLRKWGVKVNLQVQVEVKSSFNPGLSITDTLENALKVFPANGNVTIGRTRGGLIGATMISDITRTEAMGFFYDFDDLRPQNETEKLQTKSSEGQMVTPHDPAFCGKTHLAANDDLHFYDFLHSKILLALRGDTLPQTAAKLDSKGKPVFDATGRIVKVPAAPFDVLSYEVKFIVTKGASINPTWKLVTLAIDPGNAAFYAGQRVRANDLTLTFGAVTTDPNGTKSASSSLDQQHSATLIGRAVLDAIHNQ